MHCLHTASTFIFQSGPWDATHCTVCILLLLLCSSLEGHPLHCLYTASTFMFQSVRPPIALFAYCFYLYIPVWEATYCTVCILLLLLCSSLRGHPLHCLYTASTFIFQSGRLPIALFVYCFYFYVPVWEANHCTVCILLLPLCSSLGGHPLHCLYTASTFIFRHGDFGGTTVFMYSPSNLFDCEPQPILSLVAKQVLGFFPCKMVVK